MVDWVVGCVVGYLVDWVLGHAVVLIVMALLTLDGLMMVVVPPLHALSRHVHHLGCCAVHHYLPLTHGIHHLVSCAACRRSAAPYAALHAMSTALCAKLSSAASCFVTLHPLSCDPQRLPLRVLRYLLPHPLPRASCCLPRLPPRAVCCLSSPRTLARSVQHTVMRWPATSTSSCATLPAAALIAILYHGVSRCLPDCLRLPRPCALSTTTSSATTSSATATVLPAAILANMPACISWRPT